LPRAADGSDCVRYGFWDAHGGYRGAPAAANGRRGIIMLLRVAAAKMA